MLYRGIFSTCPLIWGSISKTANIFWNILGFTYWQQSIRKSNTRNFSLFVYLRSYNNESKFSILQTVQSSRNKSNLRTSHFCAKCYYHFLALIFLYTLQKIPLKNHVRFSKWNLKTTPRSAQNSFSIKSNLNFCITVRVACRVQIWKKSILSK